MARSSKQRQSLVDFEKVSVDDIADAYGHWQYNPYDYVKEVLGVKIVTAQQKQYLLELGKLVYCKAKRNKGLVLSSGETKYANKTGISIRAGKGRGKDALIAWTIIWLLDCHPDVKIPCTAPSETQLRTIVWAEVSKWLNQVNDNGEPCCAIRDEIKTQGERIYSTKAILKPGEQPIGFAFQKTALKNSEDAVEAKTMSGFHADVMAIIVTEADGVDDGTLKALESTLIMNRINFMIMASNPTRRSGLAYKSQQDLLERENWIPIHFKGVANEIISQEHIDKAKRTYGEDSNSYRVYILGEYPTAEEGAVIPWEWLNDSLERELKVPDDAPLIFGVDPAGEGSDKTMVCMRRGGKIEGFFETCKVKDDDVGDEIIQKANAMDAYEIIVLKNGVGVGYYKYIRKYFKRTIGFYEMDKPKDQKYFNRRAELWLQAREMFKDGLLSIPKFDDCDRFISELNATRLVQDPTTTRIQLESKKEIKKRLGRSPDRADAFIATLYRDIDFKTDPSRNRLTRRKDDFFNEFSWMGV